MIKKKVFKSVGIVGFGGYVPRRRLSVEEVAKVWGREGEGIINSLGVRERSVADLDEDCVTMAVEAARLAVKQAGILPKQIGVVLVGSESHPYAVKPTGTIVAEVLGVGRDYFCADLTFACKAATAGIQMVAGMIEGGLIDYGLVIGSDRGEPRPGDVLDYTTGAGAAAFVLGGKRKEFLVELKSTYSFSSDTADFWRRSGKKYPDHGGRFTGEPGYFNHVEEGCRRFLKMLNKKPKDFDYLILHMPNGKFPKRAARRLGFDLKKLEAGWLVDKIGNPYSASSLLGLCLTLERAEGGNKILMTSYGSGAGSDSFYFETRKLLERKKNNLFSESLKKTKRINYGEYLRRIEVI